MVFPLIATGSLIAKSGGSAGSFLFLLILVGCVLAWWKLRSGEALRFETTAQPQQVIMTAVSTVATKRRWATLAQTDNTVTFVYHKGPNKLLAVILFCFFIFPCILYLILAGKKESLSVFVHAEGGQSLVQATSNGWRGKGAGRALRSQLGVAPGTTAAIRAA